MNAGVEITPVLPLGVGFTSGPDGYASAVGMFGRVSGRAKYVAGDLPFNLPVLWIGPYYSQKGKFSEQFCLGGSVFDVEYPGINQRRWGRVGAHAGVLFLHLGLNLELFELLDFLVGFTGLDLSQDDVAGDQPPEDDEEAGDTAVRDRTP